MTLPEPFVVTAQRECIRTIGLYNGETHKFFPPAMDPTRNSIEVIRTAFSEYNLFQDSSDFDNILRQIRLSGDTAPEIILGTITEESLALFDIVRLYEEDGSVSVFLYLGNREFFVLDSSKSSILFKDILVCNTMPISEGNEEEFNVIRDGKPFSPKEFDGYEFPYGTKRLTKVEIVRTPSILRIIDECSRFGGTELKTVSENPKDIVTLLLNDITDVLGRCGSVALPANEEFPEYQWLLSVAKNSGVRTFVLNFLIETVEKRKKPHYAFVDSDWKKSAKWIADEEKRRHKKEVAEYNKTLEDFKKAISALRQRRVLLFFKAETKVSAETDKYIQGLIDRLEEKAGAGYGQPGFAASEYSLAKENTRPKKGENLKTGCVLLTIVAAALFFIVSWSRTENSKELFSKEIEKVAFNARADKDYLKAINQCDSLYKAFRPSYTRFAVSSAYNDARQEIEQARESEMKDLIDAIVSMREATGGRFNSYAEKALFRLLKIAPDDRRALELKQAWMEQ